MRIETVGPKDRKAIQRFINVPFACLDREPNWVPPFRGDIRSCLTRRHPFFAHSDAAFFLASENSRDIGTIAVLEHRPFNAHHGEKTAFFTLFDCRDNPEAAEGLFTQAARWVQERGLDRIIGPKGFLRSSGQGILVEGFEHFPATGIPWNPPYYARLLEGAGFTKVTDLLSGYIDYSATGDDRLYRVASIARERGAFRILAFRNRRDIETWLPAFKDLQHQAFTKNRNYIPSTDMEFDLMAKNMMFLADLSISRFITREGQLAGFIIAFPNIGRGIRRAGGTILPAGWLPILLERKRSRALDLNVLGIHPRYQKQGGDAILFTEIETCIRASRYTSAEVIQIDEKNALSRSGIEHFGVRWAKRHRIYGRETGGKG